MVGIATTVSWILSNKIVDSEGRYVILKGRLGLKDLLIAGIYAPHK